MTDAKQTKCPHCGSTFRISDAQLAAKGGSVRCGSCLQVFRADLHLVGAPRPASARPAGAVAPAPKKKAAPGDESWALDLLGQEGSALKEPPGEPGMGRDDFGFSDDDISEFIAKGGGMAPAGEERPGKNIIFDDELNEQLESVGEGLTPEEEDIDRLSDNADESWAQSILSELESEQQQEEKKKYGLEILDEKSKPGPKNPKLAAAIGQRPAPDAEEPARAPARPAPAAKPAAPAPAPVDDILAEDADVLSFLDNDDLSQPASAPPPPPASTPFSLERPLAHVDAPVELKPSREPVRWGYVLGWSFLCLFALTLFIAQYLYFNFETLAIKPSVRPVLEDVCNRLGCRLPDIPDPTKLRIEELVVRKHPTVPGALVVDAILKNNASFPQRFPTLRLHFSNAADEIIASRDLKPYEYLQGDARLLRRIPPDTPVHLSLEIVDPGKEAVGYGLAPQL